MSRDRCSPAHAAREDRRPSRRDVLWRLGGGLGGIALAQLLGRSQALAQASTLGGADLNGGLHHRAKVRRILQLFMNGGVSQVDTFDYKPELFRRHGEKFDPGERVESVTGSHADYPILKSPFEFRQYGETGRWVSSVFPCLAERVDRMAFLMSMTTKTNVHGPGSYMMNTGFTLPGFPCMGAWITYALGSSCDDLPAFVVLPDPRGLPYNNLGNFSSAFLPVANQGVVIHATAPTPVHDLLPPPSDDITPASESELQALLGEMNREYAAQDESDSRLEGRIASYELAARMQLSVPGLFDLGGESEATRKLYGMDEKQSEEFGTRCLLARRMLERGVRFVQVWSGPAGATGNWDNHADVSTELPAIASMVDRPIAGLLADLESRGMFEDTLVVFSTEFGRQPFSQGTAGRDHNGGTFVGWLAGAGIRAGATHGESDEWGWRSRVPTWCYDLHATILHLLGIDHTRLTFRHNGSNRRLTDVHGELIPSILA
jgi:hypothetical protein